MVPIYLLNLSSALNPLTVGPLSFGELHRITALNDLPRTGPLVVYILGHAVPNGLKTASGAVLPEAALAAQLSLVRGSEPTLVIVDACFAGSLQNIEGISWPANFAMIYSCLAHERSWNAAGQSVFANEIEGVMKDGPSQEPFGKLNEILIERLGGIQTPLVVDPNGVLSKIFS